MSADSNMLAILAELRLLKAAIAHAEKICVRWLEPAPNTEAPESDVVLAVARNLADRAEAVTEASNALADAIQPRLVK